MFDENGHLIGDLLNYISMIALPCLTKTATSLGTSNSTACVDENGHSAEDAAKLDRNAEMYDTVTKTAISPLCKAGLICMA